MKILASYLPLAIGQFSHISLVVHPRETEEDVAGGAGLARHARRHRQQVEVLLVLQVVL